MLMVDCEFLWVAGGDGDGVSRFVVVFFFLIILIFNF